MYCKRLFGWAALLSVAAVPAFSQTLFAPYWRVDDKTESFLELASNATTDRTFTPILLIDGVRRKVLPELTVPAHGTVRLNLRPFLSPKQPDHVIERDARPGQSRRPASWQGAAILEGDNSSAIYGWFQIETERTSVNSMFAKASRAANHLIGMWWRPTAGTIAEVSLLNTADHPITVDAWIRVGEARLPGRSLTFSPGSGKILTPEQFVGPGMSLPELGAVELVVRDGLSALQGWTLLRDLQHGFATPISMQAPAGRLSNKAHLPGAVWGEASHEFGFPEGVHFRPKLLLTNLTDEPVDLFLELSGAMSDLAMRSLYDNVANTPVPVQYQPLQVPVQTLPPNAVRIIDLADMRESLTGFLPDGFVGVELSHSGAPGDLFAEALTVDDTLKYAFHDPFMDDARAPQFMTTVSFDLSRQRNKVFVFKNTGDDPTLFHFNVFYEQAGESQIYKAIRVLDAGAVLSIDLRRLRDEAIPDMDGKVLPVDVVFGHVMVQPSEPGLRAGDYAFDGNGSFASCFDPCECDPPGFWCYPGKRKAEQSKNLICQDDPWGSSYNVTVEWALIGVSGSNCRYKRCTSVVSACNAPTFIDLPNAQGTACGVFGLRRTYTVTEQNGIVACSWNGSTTHLSQAPCAFAKDDD